MTEDPRLAGAKKVAAPETIARWLDTAERVLGPIAASGQGRRSREAQTALEGYRQLASLAGIEREPGPQHPHPAAGTAEPINSPATPDPSPRQAPV